MPGMGLAGPCRVCSGPSMAGSPLLNSRLERILSLSTLPPPTPPQPGLGEPKDSSGVAHRWAGPGQDPRLRFPDQRQPATPKGQQSTSSRLQGLGLKPKSSPRGPLSGSGLAAPSKEGSGWVVARSQCLALSREGPSLPHLSLCSLPRPQSPGAGRERSSRWLVFLDSF